MYARIAHAHYDPAKEAEVTRIAQEQLLPTYQRLPGFHSCTGGRDRTARQTFTITIWETEEQANSTGSLNDKEMQTVLAQLQGAGVVFDVAPEVYEITVQI